MTPFASEGSGYWPASREAKKTPMKSRPEMAWNEATRAELATADGLHRRQLCPCGNSL